MAGGTEKIGEERRVVLASDAWDWLGDTAAVCTGNVKRSEVIRRCIALARQMQVEDPVGFYGAVMAPGESPETSVDL